MALTSIIPVPKDPEIERPEDRRLWIGNLDPRITEYQLLKLLQPFGAIEKFDLLFHKSGPLAGQPRGYAFVTYTEKSHALSMMTAVEGKYLGTKRLVVRWAHTMTKTEMEKPKVEIKIPALIGAKEENKLSRSARIKAIESKLKMMEGDGSGELLTLAEQLPSTSRGAPMLNPQKKEHLHKNHQTYFKNKTKRRNYPF